MRRDRRGARRNRQRVRLDPRTTALLVIDLQQDTVDEEGAFASSGAAAFDYALTTVATRATADEVIGALAP